MKNIWSKILLIILMLVPIPFSCKVTDDCPDFNVLPYYDIRGMVFKYVDSYNEYYYNNNKYIIFEKLSQDYDNEVYTCENMALYFEAPDSLLQYHSRNNIKHGFGFTQEVHAECKRSGWAGTREMVDKIFISSGDYDFDETHPKHSDLSDIVEIFAYSANKKDEWRLLRDYNQNSPYEAPKRFYLLIKRRPTLSKTQQFVIRYYMLTQPGEASEYYVITTPVFQVH